MIASSNWLRLGGHKRGLVALLATLFVAASGALAQRQDPVYVDAVTGGFSDIVRQGGWYQRLAALVNTSEQDRTVRIRFRGGQTPSGETYYTRVVQLPAGTRRLAWYSIRSDSLNRTGRMMGQSGMSQAEEFHRLEDFQTQQKLGNELNRMVTVMPGDSMPVFAIGGLWEDLPPETVSSMLYETCRSTYGRAQSISLAQSVRYLPDRWYGYSLAKVILIGQADLTSVRHSQLEAMLDWVREGGVLLIVGSEQAPAMLDGPLGWAAGVMSQGMHEVANINVVHSNGQPLANVKLRRAVPMMELAGGDAEVLYRAGSLPLLTRKAVGKGWVFTLACSMVGLEDEALRPVMREIDMARTTRQPIHAKFFNMDSSQFDADDPPTADQIEKLQDWIRQGHSIVIAATELEWASTSWQLEQYTGVDIRSAGKSYVAANFKVLDASGKVIAERAQGPWPFAGMVLRPRSGTSTGGPSTSRAPAAPAVEVLLRAQVTDKSLAQPQTLPLLTRHPLGNGWLYVLATLPQAMDGADFQQARMIYESAGAVSLTEAIEQVVPLRPAQDTLEQIAGRRGPPKRIPAGILAGLAAVVAVGGIVLVKVVRRGEIVWIILVPLAMLLAAGAWVYSRTLTEPERISSIGLAWGLGNGTADVREIASYYSPTGRQTTFAGDTDRGIIMDVGKAAAIGQQLEIRGGERMSLPDREVGLRSTRGVYAQDIIPLAGPSSSLTFGPEGLVGSLTNPMAVPVEDAVLHINGQGYRIGSLGDASKGPTNLRIGPAQALAPGELTSDVIPTIQAQLRNDLLAHMAPRRKGVLQLDDRPLLIAHVNRSLLRLVQSDTPVDQQGWSILVWPLELTAPPAGTRVLVPMGFARLQARRTAGAPWQMAAQTWSGGGMPTSLDTLLMRLTPPQPIVLSDATIRLDVGMRAVGYRVTVLGIASDDSPPVELWKADNPQGNYQLQFPQADRFVGLDGEYRFNIRIQSIQTSAEVPVWTMDKFGAVLEGTSR